MWLVGIGENVSNLRGLQTSAVGHRRGQMKDNKLYTIVTKNDHQTPLTRAEPSEYFLNLPPQEAIAELNAHIRSLENKLGEYTNVDLKVRENLEKARKVSFELEVAHDLLRRVKKDQEPSE